MTMTADAHRRARGNVKPTVAIFAQGAMGAGLAGVLSQHGLTVLTNLEGRSPASADRAGAAGMRSVPWDEFCRADVILSVLPPAEALNFARRLAPLLAQRAPAALYVDCNAICPETVREVGAVTRAGGAEFADIGIIGAPPRAGGPQPRLYCAGDGRERLAALCEYGLEVRALDGPVGTASALKMAYGGITKGLIAVASAMILGAARADIGVQLERELSESEPQLLASLSRRVTDMLPKAYRWVGEMQEISRFLSADPAASAIYGDIAGLYRRLAQDVAGDRREAEVLEAFFRSPAR
jgi:3-hydroxyisobutyrate dehydrogenase-like beta-hydroxyacid dehydrogenase